MEEGGGGSKGRRKTTVEEEEGEHLVIRMPRAARGERNKRADERQE
jgi:hypothetical protein